MPERWLWPLTRPEKKRWPLFPGLGERLRLCEPLSRQGFGLRHVGEDGPGRACDRWQGRGPGNPEKGVRQTLDPDLLALSSLELSQWKVRIDFSTQSGLLCPLQRSQISWTAVSSHLTGPPGPRHKGRFPRNPFDLFLLRLLRVGWK